MAVDNTSGARPPHRARWMAAELTRKGGRRGGGVHGEAAMAASRVSHPGSGKLNRSLHTCAQDVQITRTSNNMVNRYNISLNYKLESFTK
jgi:hypothetical protein